jgi:transcriptional regulator with XRE-family HTH domain
MSSVYSQPVGDLLRDWRKRRRWSQLDLACEAEISSRHLSFLETGRSAPSREMVLRLARKLEIPLRERNSLLVAAGYAPVFKATPLEDPTLNAARTVIDLLLRGHEPYPALAIDRHWTMLSANRMVSLLLQGIDPALLEPPVNVLRLTLHPSGLASRITNLTEWRWHLFARLHREIDVTADPVLVELLNELSSYPMQSQYNKSTILETDFAGVAVPFQIATEAGVLSFLSTTTVFGTPVDITLSEIAMESFFPADNLTLDTLNVLFKQDQQGKVDQDA